MDRQVAKKNKTDGRDFWFRCWIAGREAFRKGCGKMHVPEGLSLTAKQEWISGWCHQQEIWRERKKKD